MRKVQLLRKKLKRRLQRTKPTAEPYDRVLVVCEGSKTEPLYLAELRKHYRLSVANIQVFGAGVDPISLVRHAEKLASQEKKQGEAFDRVYCVFDRNAHVNFVRASEKAKRLGMRLARSWPCFEFWLLLHFEYKRSPYSATAQQSTGQICISELIKHLPGYTKGGDDIFFQLLPRLDWAVKNARQTRIDAQNTGEDNPSTEFHELVEYLQSLARH